MKTCFISIAAVSLLMVASSVHADETKSTAPDAAAAGDMEGKRKALLDFVKGQRQKAWDFEDKIVQKTRQFQDEERRSKRDAELEDEATLATNPDFKAARKLIVVHKRERYTAWQKKVAEQRKGIEKERKDFRMQAEAERKAFRQTLGTPLKDNNKKPPGKKNTT